MIIKKPALPFFEEQEGAMGYFHFHFSGTLKDRQRYK